MPIMRKLRERMLARWPSLCIQAETMAWGVPSEPPPQPMFSPIVHERRERVQPVRLMRVAKLAPLSESCAKKWRATMSWAWPEAARPSLWSRCSGRRPCARRCALSRHSVVWLAAPAPSADGAALAPAQPRASEAPGATANADTAMTDETMNLRSIEDLPTDPEATPETHSAARPAPHPEEPRGFATPSRDGCAFVVGGAVCCSDLQLLSATPPEAFSPARVRQPTFDARRSPRPASTAGRAG